MYEDDFDVYQFKLDPTDIHQNIKFQVDNIDLYLNLQEPSCQEHQEIHENYNVKPQTYQRVNHDYYQIDKYLKIQTNVKDLYLQQSRKDKLNRYLRKKNLRVWKKKISYASRQKIAKQRQRVNGKFTSGKKMESPEQTAKINPQYFLLSPPNQGLKIQTTEWLEP